MPQHLRRVADELPGRYLADLDRVVRNKAVSALDELNGRFALADAAVAEDQHALAVHVDEHAVACDDGRERVIQVVDGHGGELDGRVLRAKQRAAVLLRHLEALRENI